MTNEQTIPQTIRIAFQRFQDMVEKHQACHHNMFPSLAEKARTEGLTSEQVDIFSKAIMARIYRTIPNIAGLVQTAILNNDDELAKTAMKNLNEEIGGEKTHKQLAEEAFNSLRAGFNLKPLTLKEAHDMVPLPESYTQEQVWISGYKDFPAIASWLQERASGGDNKKQLGMMADIFEVFEACRNKIGDENFKKQVLPYFAAHIKISAKEDGGFRAIPDNNAVEFQHGERAKRAALNEFVEIVDGKKEKIITKMATAFLNAQDELFRAIALCTGITNQQSQQR